jgi:hypothetical protein
MVQGQSLKLQDHDVCRFFRGELSREDKVAWIREKGVRADAYR